MGKMLKMKLIFEKSDISLENIVDIGSCGCRFSTLTSADVLYLQIIRFFYFFFKYIFSKLLEILTMMMNALNSNAH